LPSFLRTRSLRLLNIFLNKPVTIVIFFKPYEKSPRLPNVLDIKNDQDDMLILINLLKQTF
jgi:hypothetical protein